MILLKGVFNRLELSTIVCSFVIHFLCFFGRKIEKGDPKLVLNRLSVSNIPFGEKELNFSLLDTQTFCRYR